MRSSLAALLGGGAFVVAADGGRYPLAHFSSLMGGVPGDGRPRAPVDHAAARAAVRRALAREQARALFLELEAEERGT